MFLMAYANTVVDNGQESTHLFTRYKASIFPDSNKMLFFF